jgi:hypothetical protein
MNDLAAKFLSELLDKLFSSLLEDLPELLGKLFSSLLKDLPELLGKLFSNLLKDLPELLGKLFSRLKDLPEIAIALLVAFPGWAYGAFRDLVAWLPDFFGRLLAQRFADDPKSGYAFEFGFSELRQAFAAHWLAFTFALVLSVCILFAFVGGPLLYKFLFKRRVEVFVSFNRTRESVVEELHSSLKSAGLGTLRIPFRDNAAHQEIVGEVAHGIKSCDALVCVPGLAASFVESEVMAATAGGKAVVFLVTENQGTLPDTADKRYPVFKLETTQSLRFEPLCRFLHYVCADFLSRLEIAKRALGQPFMSVSLFWGLSILLAGMVVLWGYNYFSVLKTGYELTRDLADAADGREAAVIAQFVLLGAVSTAALLVAAYTGLVILNTLRQRATQRKAILKVAKAAFARDEWTGLVPGLAKGTLMYQCMFEGPALAHHEFIRTEVN